jgi:hypothetical protein
MPSIQTRAPKSKPAPKLAGRGTIVAAKKANSEPPPGPGSSISVQEREMMIARSAYFRAEKRGFVPGSELQDWVEAEAEVLQLIGN